jgi:hypothetical protein
MCLIIADRHPFIAPVIVSVLMGLDPARAHSVGCGETFPHPSRVVGLAPSSDQTVDAQLQHSAQIRLVVILTKSTQSLRMH